MHDCTLVIKGVAHTGIAKHRRYHNQCQMCISRDCCCRTHRMVHAKRWTVLYPAHVSHFPLLPEVTEHVIHLIDQGLAPCCANQPQHNDGRDKLQRRTARHAYGAWKAGAAAAGTDGAVLPSSVPLACHTKHCAMHTKCAFEHVLQASPAKE